MEILLWDRDGFALWYKRLETGVFKLPRVQEGVRSVELRASELAMVLDGIDVSKLKRVPRYARISQENQEKEILASPAWCGALVPLLSSRPVQQTHLESSLRYSAFFVS